MHKRLLPLLALLLLGRGHALTVTGNVTGSVPAEARVGAWAVSASGQPVQELLSAPVQSGGEFRLNLPTAPPSPRVQVPLTAQNVAWPGVLDPVTVSGSALATELRLFIYRDANRNGQRDEGEPLREVTPNAGRGTLLTVWVSADVTVRAGRGYEATLKRGWNALVVEVGRAVRVTPVTGDAVDVSLSLGR
ncbi:hypothetical protein [Deinococcus sp. YIM 77859]|uniref:hypothetical protein n=1 Tax=Deinococcus sp. YIM 77859 TaxID=1540221 RepID=UPI0005551490|nr:hypothetical protein [Deinococcus sp. YIM 77859]